MSEKSKRVCVDVGGTFTDCLVMDETGLLQKFKSSTTPSDPSKGFMAAMQKAALHYGIGVNECLSQIEVLVHGTTLATNILLTGRGAKAGMLTTKNFRDIIGIYKVVIDPATLQIDQCRSIRRQQKNCGNRLWDQVPGKQSSAVSQNATGIVDGGRRATNLRVSTRLGSLR